MRKRVEIILMALVILFCMCLTGCGRKKEEYDYNLFYLNQSEDALITKGYNVVSNNIQELIDELIRELSTQPEEKEYKIPGLDIAAINECIYIPEGYVIVDFDSAYNSIPFIKEILCRAAIVKTLCQIEGVNGVEFTIDGEKYIDGDGEEYGYMSEETFVDNTSGETTYKQTINVSLYFAGKKGNKLVKLPVNLTFDGTISLEQLVVNQLIKGPSAISGADKELKAAISENAAVNQITVREQICYIDFNKEFMNSIPGVSKEVTLYSVVNTLSELPAINKVQFTIDGETVRYFGDNSIAFDVPLERNLELIKE